MAVTVSVVAVALARLVKPPPRSVCHCTAIGNSPLAEALKVAAPPLHAVTSAGCSVMLIGVATTVTVKTQVLALPLLSRAVLVTVVSPSGKANPLAGTLVTLVTAQLSLALTVKVTLLVHTPGAAFTVRSSGQLICGG